MKLSSVPLLLTSALLLHSSQAQETPESYPSNGALAAQLQPYVDKHIIPGAVVLVASKDKILDLESVGYANIAAQKPMPPDGVFEIASMSKPVCATAVMMLAQEGKLSVDDPVEKYLPEFKGQMYIAEHDANHVLLKKPTHPVLIRNLLTHTSGLPYSSLVERPNIPHVAPESWPLDSLPLETAVRSYAMTPLMFDPDAKYSYASAGINTAARIVEVVSGMPYAQFLEERIFQPLGMKDTTFWPNEEEIARHPSFYKPGPGRIGLIEEPTVGRLTYPLSDRAHRYPIPGSGLFSTAVDMAHFCQMYLNNGVYDGKTLLTPASVQALTTKETPPNVKTQYGYGWATDHDTYSHGGSFHTFMHVWPQKGLITIFMTQIESNWPKGGEVIIPHFQDLALSTFKQQ